MKNEELVRLVGSQQATINAMQKQLNTLSQDYYNNKGTLFTRFKNVNQFDTNSLVGFFGATPIKKQTIAATATDAATTQTLANSIRTILISFGLVV